MAQVFCAAVQQYRQCSVLSEALSTVMQLCYCRLGHFSTGSGGACSTACSVVLKPVLLHRSIACNYVGQTALKMFACTALHGSYSKLL
jgi:hypothetical protein